MIRKCNANPFARVAVENTAYHFDKAFDYLIPEELLEQAKPGCRVLVPFGAGNAQRLAMILEVSPEKETQNTTKQVVAVLDEAPLLTNEAIQLVFWLKDRYFCTLFEAVKLLLPAGIHYRMKTEYALAKGRPVEKEALSKEESALIEYLAGKGKPVEREKLLKAMGLPADSPLPENLFKRGLLEKTGAAVRQIKDAAQKMVRLTGEESPC